MDDQIETLVNNNPGYMLRNLEEIIHISHRGIGKLLETRGYVIP